jgi:hypothetical protein
MVSVEVGVRLVAGVWSFEIATARMTDGASIGDALRSRP